MTILNFRKKLEEKMRKKRAGEKSTFDFRKNLEESKEKKDNIPEKVKEESMLSFSTPSSFKEALQREKSGFKGILSGAAKPLKELGVPLPNTPKPTTSAGKLGEFLGESAMALPFMEGPGEAVVGARALIKGTEKLTPAMEAAIRSLGRLAGNTTYGGIMEGQEGALKGAVTTVGLEGIPAIAAAVKYATPSAFAEELLKKVNLPTETAEQQMKTFIDSLGNGNLADKSIQAIASDVKGKAKEIGDNYKDKLGSVLAETDKYKNMYNTPKGFVPKTFKKDLDNFISSGDKLPISFFKKGTSETPSGVLTAFEKAPTIRNADELQKELGKYERSIPPSATRQNIKSLRNSLKYDISNSLSKTLSPEAAKRYVEASDYYYNEYLPYRDVPIIDAVVNTKGKPVAGKTFLKEFLEPKMATEQGKEEMFLAANKIRSDLGPEADKKLLHAYLAPDAKNPKKVLDKIEKLSTTETGTSIINNALSQDNLSSQLSSAQDTIESEKAINWIKNLQGEPSAKIAESLRNPPEEVKKFLSDISKKELDKLQRKIIWQKVLKSALGAGVGYSGARALGLSPSLAEAATLAAGGAGFLGGKYGETIDPIVERLFSLGDKKAFSEILKHLYRKGVSPAILSSATGGNE